jgi:carboxyl-terminal processing protease
MKTATRIIIGALLAFILVASGFASGFVLARVTESDVPSPSGSVGVRVDEVRRLLDAQALNPPSEASATAGAIQGLLSSNNDRYAEYFDKRHYAYFNEESMGSFGGIGVVLGETSGTVTVIEVYKGTPAEKGGVKKGDQFKRIDKETRAHWTSDEVVKRVRGPEGTQVTITFYRPSTKSDYTVTLTRGKVKVPNIQSEMVGKVGYMRLGEFNAQSEDDVRAAITELTKKGAKAFVLDLRDNPGGLLDQAVSVSSLFVADGVIVKVEERGKQPESYRATGDLATKLPLVVLVNQNSASASEIFGGAMQDYGRAKLVGVKTFGKGSVQTIRDLSFGGGVKFTIAHYLTPKGRAINGVGLTPDIVVPMAFEKQMDRKTDVQFKRAIEEANNLAK